MVLLIMFGLQYFSVTNFTIVFIFFNAFLAYNSSTHYQIKKEKISSISIFH